VKSGGVETIGHLGDDAAEFAAMMILVAGPLARPAAGHSLGEVARTGGGSALPFALKGGTTRHRGAEQKSKQSAQSKSHGSDFTDEAGFDNARCKRAVRLRPGLRLGKPGAIKSG